MSWARDQEPWVLIETLWNVKEKECSQYPSSEESFNRNIVECKGERVFTISVLGGVLIETLWNVKEEGRRKKDRQAQF